ncbi:MAG: diguanylate cyclase [Acidobacteria bacterium]|nr:diguanylate cyclase [Acidobacteriota bacterium]MBS1866008.1 diguanylate cyclase [Acidobacteriota bacterium]
MKWRVLIADDDSLSRRMLKSTLERSGYEVISVEDGSAASAVLCEADGPRMALLDWMMPGLDGPAVVRAVRVRRGMQYVHMILLTSRQSKEDVVAGLDAGADDYLTKPFNPQELRARLRTGERILHLEDTLVQAREEMRYRATHDALTGLWNRGVILELLQREIQRGKRDQHPGGVTVLLADIDHFKNVNDTFGHAAGDNALRRVAKHLTDSVRNYDAVSRYGGEEFLVILPACDAKSGCDRAEHIRHTLEITPIASGDIKIPITLSIGAANSAEWPALEAEALIRKADEALYKAKSDGRNRVIISRPQGFGQVRSAGQLSIA